MRARSVPGSMLDAFGTQPGCVGLILIQFRGTLEEKERKKL